MAVTCQFVSDVVTSPTVNLNLNDTTRASGFMLGSEGLGLTPPPLRRVSASTMMADGEAYPATAYANRVVRVPLVLTTGTDNAAAAAMRQLVEELDKPQNVLLVQIGTQPVYFRTYRSEAVLDMARNLLRDGKVTLELPADPFALAVEQTAFNGNISANPAGTNPTYVDLASTVVKGDVPAPAIFTHAGGGNSFGTQGGQAWTFREVAYAIRSRFTPSLMPWFLQAETSGVGITLGPNSALRSADATLSNSAGVRYTPPSSAQVLALTGPLTTSVSTLLAGRYRVLVAVRTNVAADVFYLQLKWGPATLTPPDFTRYNYNTEVMVRNSDGANTGTGLTLIDLGTVDMSALGMQYGETTQQVGSETPYLDIYARRASGTGTLDVDYIAVLPADEGLAVVRHFVYGGQQNNYDGVNQTAWSGGTSLVRVNSVKGGPIMLVPGVAQRVWVQPGLGSDIITTNSYATTITYFPRYLLVPGATL